MLPGGSGWEEGDGAAGGLRPAAALGTCEEAPCRCAWVAAKSDEESGGLMGLLLLAFIHASIHSLQEVRRLEQERLNA